jgi:chitodextrinase
MRRARVAAPTASTLLLALALVPLVPAAATVAPAAAAPPAVVDVTVDADDVAADNVNGLTFKGFGVLSANSTSALLMDYKAEHPQEYSRLLQTLFGGDRPIMNHVKIEMGNDRNNSTGSDVATMRTADEPANVARHPGFQLAADAKKVNPDLRVSILRWNAPAWVDSDAKVYTWYKNTILAAYRTYGYMVDYVNPGVNEHAADLAWTQEFAHLVRTDTAGYVSDDPALAGFRDGEADLFHRIQVVISDEVGTGTFGDEMVADAALRDAVSVAAFHYSTDDDAVGSFTRLAEELDKEVWNSEAQATFSNTSFRPQNNTADPTVAGTGIGGTNSALEMANTVVKGFVNSRRTHFVYQPAIGSFYEGGQYSYKELVSARDPWSGWVHYDGGLAVLQHFSSFADTGWENPANTAGIWRVVPEASATGATGTNPVNGRNGTPSYLTLAAPDRSDFSTVVVNDSEYPRTYRITPEDFDLGAAPTLAVWETRAAEDGEAFDARYKQHVADAEADADGAYTVEVAPYSVATVTSLDVSGDESWARPLPVEGERTVLDADPAHGVLWSDDFDYTGRTVPVIGADGAPTGETEDFVASRGGDTGAIPLYTWDRNGAFEAYPTDDGERVLRQQVDRRATGVGGAWNGADPITGVGDLRWANYTASVDVRFERAPAADNYAAIGARSTGGDRSHSLGGTPYALKLVSDGRWQLLRLGAVVADGTRGGWDATAWHRIGVRVVGAQVTALVDGEPVARWTDSAPFLSGRVDLASGFAHTQFDDLRVERVDGAVPYYAEYLDGFETTDLADPPAPKLVYSGDWAHANGRGMYEYQRTASTNRSAGATVSYTFTGSGLDVVGPNDGSARLDVRVDGELVATNVATRRSASYQQAFALRGLPYGEHTVTLEVIAGALDVDAVGVVGTAADGVAPTDALAQELARAEAVERDEDYTDADWALLQTSLRLARQAVEDPAGYRLDVEGAGQLAERLRAATSPLAGRVVSVAPVHVAAVLGEEPRLPETVTATLTDGTERRLPVEWDLSEADLTTAWSVVDVPGTYGGAATSARVEVVPPGVVAFGDVNGTAAALGADSPSYRAVADAVAADGRTLLNGAPDQELRGDATWGHVGRNASGGRDVQYKGVVAGPYDKTTTTGLYTANQVGATVGYTFDLPAGRYTVAAGSHSWWASNSRTYDVYLDHGGVEHRVQQGVTLNAATPSRLLRFDLTLEEAGPVTLRLRATNAQSPMLSWVSVVAGSYDVAYDVNGGRGATPEARSGLLWSDAGLVPDGADLARESFELTGWNTEADGTGVAVDAGTTFADLAGGDRSTSEVTLYAQWEPTVPAWDATATYDTGDRVAHDGAVWAAQWWTRGETPGASTRGAWAEVGAYAQCAVGATPRWTDSWVYTGGETVAHDGKLWTARWWTRDQQPGTSRRDPWQEVGSCA